MYRVLARGRLRVLHHLTKPLGIFSIAWFAAHAALKKPLKCEHAKSDDIPTKKGSALEASGISVDKLKSYVLDLSPPSLQSVSEYFSKFGRSLDEWRNLFIKVYDELQGGPGSLYDKVVNETRKDAQLNPEIEWTAKVRVGTDLCHQEKAFLKLRQRRMRKAFANMFGLEEESIDYRDLPVMGISASGGGYRAMTNTAGSLQAAQKLGLLDVTSYLAGISGSCWSIGLLYSMANGNLASLLQHMKSRMQVDFFDPVTLDLLSKPKTDSYLLSGPIIKQAGLAGDISLVDLYGVLVSSRLWIPDNLSHLKSQNLKVSQQQRFFVDGRLPMPIYNFIHHDIRDVNTEKDTNTSDLMKNSIPFLKQAQNSNIALPTDGKVEVLQRSRYQWFELNPFEVGSAEVGGFIPTWSFGRLFEKGVSIERQPELSLITLNGVFASAFCATLQHYYTEIKPLISTFSFFNRIDEMVEGYEKTLSIIHPFPPCALANPYKDLGDRLLSNASEEMTKKKSLSFMDAGAYCNLPYVPLFRRHCDIIIALDASADSQSLWFERAQEFATSMKLSSWPAIRSESLFQSRPGGEEVTPKGAVGEAELQASNMESMPAVPTSTDETNEPPLKAVNIWIGGVKKARHHRTRVVDDEDVYEIAKERDGMALVYIPLSHGPNAKEIADTWSTYRFEYPMDQTDKLLQIANDNFTSGERQMKDLLRGVYERKKAARLMAEGTAKS